MSAMTEAKQALDDLTNREREVCVLTARGLNADQVGDRLCLSPYTVKTHLYNAFRRLGLKNGRQLAVLCALAGEVTDWKEAA
jgi:DNA-binding CsgD family transcriptional regulator